MWQDVRYSVRILSKRRAFAATAVLVLALGIGLHTAMFALVNGLLFRPLSARHPDQLRFVYLTDPGLPDFASGIRYGDYVDLRTRRDVFLDLAARRSDVARLSARDDVRQARGELVSGNYFDVLGVAPLLGRTIVADDDRPAADPVVVISTDLWKARFDSDAAVLGQTLRIGARAYTIVGVMPFAFRGTLGPWELTQYWAPLRQRAVDLECSDPLFLDHAGLALIGRLRPDITSQAAHAALSNVRLVPTAVPAAGSARDRLWSVTLFSSGRFALPFDSAGRTVPSRLAAGLMLVSGLVLLIAAVNLAGMLTARGVTRQSEMATRIVLGAGRWRVTRQVMIESLLLAFAGGAAGALLARWMVVAFSAAVPGQLRRFDPSGTAPAQAIAVDAPLDWHVLAYTLLVCIVVGIVVGLIPARRAASTGAFSVLTNGGGGLPQRVATRLRHWVVLPQVSLCLVLLLVAAVLVRTVAAAQMLEPGYEASALVSVTFASPRMCRGQRATEQETRARRETRDRFHQQALAAVVAVPGVASASLTSVLPLESPNGGRTWLVARESADASIRHQGVSHAAVSPGYFATMTIPIVRGRAFDARDAAEGAPVIIVSESLASRWWGDGNALGQQVAFADPNSTAPPQWRHVIGIAGDVRSPLSESAANPVAYTPIRPGDYARILVARGTIGAAQLLQDVKSAMARVDPSFEIGDGATVTDSISRSLYPRRLGALVLGLSGLMGLLLALVGIYGVVSYSVAERTREIGVRIALGAGRGDILRLISRDGARMAVTASAIGLVLGYAAIRVTSNRLVALPGTDPLTFVLVPSLLGIVVVAACYIPARRATRVDPMTALRDL